MDSVGEASCCRLHSQSGCCPVKEGEPEWDRVEVEAQLWGKPNKVMANLVGSK